MIFLSSVAATLVFYDHSGEIIHINISTSVGVEPTNAACAPSTATSDVLHLYTIEASLKRDAQVAYITTPDAAVHSVYGFYIYYFSVQNYDISLICSSDTCLLRPQWRHNLYILTSVGVEPTNAACAPSTATSDVLNYFSVQNYDISLICSSDTCLLRPQRRHNLYKYFDFCGG